MRGPNANRQRRAHAGRYAPDMRILAAPFRLLAGLLAAGAGRKLFKRTWAAANTADPPRPTDRDETWRRVLGAAALEGLIVAVARATMRRGGAATVAHLTGVWPGQRTQR